ncbi:MAG: MAPEG family protein [Deltaproteobacteria bacterium]|nr:MAPEG family protein [Deltaproteobacteria bacterium]MBW2416430.1 MAPEG family protein [Deltaproteobacteria bacterium]
MEANAILLPIFVMGLLHVVMFVWMLVTRLPAMTKAGLSPQDARDTSALKSLPPEVAQVADNYNHLFEQPVLFYAVAISIAVLGHVDALHVACAWVFTGLRIAHSLVQATINVVNIRFTLFLLAWIALAVMIVREALALLS